MFSVSIGQHIQRNTTAAAHAKHFDIVAISEARMLTYLLVLVTSHRICDFPGYQPILIRPTIIVRLALFACENVPCNDHVVAQAQKHSLAGIAAMTLEHVSYPYPAWASLHHTFIWRSRAQMALSQSAFNRGN